MDCSNCHSVLTRSTTLPSFVLFSLLLWWCKTWYEIHASCVAWGGALDSELSKSLMFWAYKYVNVTMVNKLFTCGCIWLGLVYVLLAVRGLQLSRHLDVFLFSLSSYFSLSLSWQATLHEFFLFLFLFCFPPSLHKLTTWPNSHLSPIIFSLEKWVNSHPWNYPQALHLHS